MNTNILKKRYFWLIIIFILLMSGGSRFFTESYQTILLFTFLLGLFIYKKKKFNRIYFLIAIFWILINLISSKLINPNQPFSLITPFTRLIQLTNVYLIIALVGYSFFDKLNDFFYKMSIVSIVLFLIQLILPNVVQTLGSPFSIITKPGYTEAGSWYSFVYMFNTWHIDRNCGFMWEPGAFAGILILMITYRLSKFDFKLDKYIYVYFSALMTTMSTAGFLALSIILISYFIKKGKRYAFLIILLPLVIYGFITFYKNSEFMSGKINVYLESGSETWGQMENGVFRVSRLGMAMITLDESFHWPFGHGVITHSEFKLNKYGRIWGPGSLSSVLHQYGWIGLIGIFILIFKFFRINVDPLSSRLFTVAMGIILFSNPDSFLFIIFSIVFYMIIDSRSFINYETQINGLKSKEKTSVVSLE